MSTETKILPPSADLDVTALSRLFTKTTNSYKYLFFLSLLNLCEQQKFDVSRLINLREILVEMLALAWYPHTHFGLSFGVQDTLTRKLDALQLPMGKPGTLFTSAEAKQLRSAINSHRLDSSLLKYVPFRIVRPFFEQELLKKEDQTVNQQIEILSREQFSERKPLFCFSDKGESVLLHPQWVAYIQKHYSVLQNWASLEWIEYMQRRNPQVNDLSDKLFPELSAARSGS